MAEDAFSNINKFIKWLVTLFVIGVMGALGSLALDYIALHGFADFITWIVLGLILLCVFIFICKINGKVIDLLIYLIKKI